MEIGSDVFTQWLFVTQQPLELVWTGFFQDCGKYEEPDASEYNRHGDEHTLYVFLGAHALHDLFEGEIFRAGECIGLGMCCLISNRGEDTVANIVFMYGCEGGMESG